jgi:BirA family biotin operon repressor/biotin-[acetyl-CoA-carboxylase] ligase
MATPYLQFKEEEVPSTQDLARAKLDELPVVAIAASQTRGRGRSGAEWVTAPRALAVSLAFHHDDDWRPFSLMAGVAACRAADADCRLKWPNDVMLGEEKVGGILVEESGGVMVVGFGLNLWWLDPPEGSRGLYVSDPGPDRHAEIGALWAVEIMGLIDEAGWPIDEYRGLCTTLGREIAWEPDGSGEAVDIDGEGGLIVASAEGRRTITSGAVRHLFHS